MLDHCFAVHEHGEMVAAVETEPVQKEMGLDVANWMGQLEQCGIQTQEGIQIG